MGEWTLFSNHGHVLFCLAGNNQARLRDVAEQVGITERAVQKIVRELQDAGYLTITKHGRCNRYRIHARKTLRHPIESHCTVARLVRLMVRGSGPDADEPAAAPAPEKKPAVQQIAPEPPGTGHPASMPEPSGWATEPPPARAQPPKPEPGKDAQESGEPPDTRHQGSLF